MMGLWKNTFPTYHAHYFRQRFGPINGRVMVFSSFESLAEWEDFQNQMRTNADYRKLMGQWLACWDLSSHDEYFWDEEYVKVMTRLATST